MKSPQKEKKEVAMSKVLLNVPFNTLNNDQFTYEITTSGTGYMLSEYKKSQNPNGFDNSLSSIGFYVSYEDALDSIKFFASRLRVQIDPSPYEKLEWELPITRGVRIINERPSVPVISGNCPRCGTRYVSSSVCVYCGKHIVK